MQGHSGCRFVGGPRQCTSPVVATTDISDFGIVRCCSFFRASDWPYQTAVVVKHLPLDSCVMPVTALRASRTTAERADRDRWPIDSPAGVAATRRELRYGAVQTRARSVACRACETGRPARPETLLLERVATFCTYVLQSPSPLVSGRLGARKLLASPFVFRPLDYPHSSSLYLFFRRNILS
jgi:hypothetical protein